ncbi:MAG: mannose-1-phosphate guanylyltransferase/mannose-6-phosphate isomerase [Deltaproteobacteria bacterium]|nr:MAG: mannose-1-phosphate guanylyltransferase/mannose-6-phosphate isomerase [Deltaproteobacteria bacterium]
MIRPVILAGGSGTRLWPLSRALYPKQLLNLTSDLTLLQSTVLRLNGLSGVGEPLVICNDAHRFLVAEQLRQIGVQPAGIILEPVGRNTAPAVAVAAIRTMEAGGDPVLLVLPADHYIADVKAFHATISTAQAFAETGSLMTFGIVPDAPETGYGYIRMGEPIQCEGGSGGTKTMSREAFRIAEFVEKPDIGLARNYLASGLYCWNSGMFMFRASVVVGELKKHVPEIYGACHAACEGGQADLDFYRLDEPAFRACPEDSIDYAVMEKTDCGAMVALDAGWNDIGSWEALWQIGDKDSDHNVINGDVVLHDVKNSFFHAGSRMIAAVGMEDLVVVETSDAVFISPRERAQDVKKLVSRIKSKNRDEAISHKRVYRPWGSYETIDISERFQVKRITVKPGAVLSLQKHFHRSEHWVVVRGTALVTQGTEETILKEDESTYIRLGQNHRLKNPGKIPLELIEVQTGSYLGEDDIVRMEDVYGR